MKHILLSALLMGALAPAFPLRAAEAAPVPPRAEAEQLEERVRDLKAAGRHEEARRLMEEARALRTRAERPPEVRERQRELRRERAEMDRQLQQLRREGRERDIAQLEQRIARLDREAAGLARRAAPARPPAPPPPSAPAARVRPEQLEHLRIAIDHLRAAGLHPAADRLARLHENLSQRARPAPGPEQFQPWREELRRLKAEQEELRQMLRRLHERLEQLQRDRR